MNEATRTRFRLVHITTVPQSLRWLAGQIQYMKLHGMEVFAISSPSEYLETFSRQEDVIVYAVKMSRSISIWTDLVAIYDLMQILRFIDPDIVHVHTPKAGFLGMISATLSEVPVRIYHNHGLRFTTLTGFRRQILKITERLSCMLSHQVLCVSPSVMKIIISAGICPAYKIKVLRHGSIDGVDAKRRFNPSLVNNYRKVIRDRLGIPQNSIVLGFIGRISKDKGIRELVLAWNTLRKIHSEIQLLIVGRFETEDPIDYEISNIMENDNRIHLTGFIQDVEEMYSTIDILILPSHREGFPITILEASATAIPVVATKIPGCIDAVIDGVTGTLVPTHSVRLLAIAIEKYIKDPKMRKNHGLTGRSMVSKNFVPEDMWLAQHAEYRRLLRNLERRAGDHGTGCSEFGQ